MREQTKLFKLGEHTLSAYMEWYADPNKGWRFEAQLHIEGRYIEGYDALGRHADVTVDDINAAIEHFKFLNVDLEATPKQVQTIANTINEWKVKLSPKGQSASEAYYGI